MYSLRKLKINERAFLLILVLGLIYTALIYIFLISGKPESLLAGWGFAVACFAPFTIIDFLRTKNYLLFFPLAFQLLAPLSGIIAFSGGIHANREILLFLMFNGHHILITALVESFKVIEPGFLSLKPEFVKQFLEEGLL